MLTLTKMKRAYVIDHIMPSDLDKNNIKNGLKLKEEMIDSITDDYIKEIIPDWKQIERDYRKRGVSDIMEKINCGELTLDDIQRPNPIKYDVWIRWKDFDVNAYNADPMYGLKDYDYVLNPFNKLVCHITDEDNAEVNNKLMSLDNNRYVFVLEIGEEGGNEINTPDNMYYYLEKLDHNYSLKIYRRDTEISSYLISNINDNILYFNKGKIKVECLNEYRDGYSEWHKFDDTTREYNFTNKRDTVFQMKIVLYGDNHDRYAPFQNYEINNGWNYISDNIDLYDFEAGMNEPFYRLFFRNKSGYGDIMYKGWHWENYNWFKNNYPFLVDETNRNVNASTILCDPFRVKYNQPPPKGNMIGSRELLSGRQWVKSKYLCDMYLLCNFSIHIDNVVINS